ncbi:MAG: MFS transporter [Candidatus Sericytochromatia bacterium]
MAPTLLLALIAGGLADLFDRRRLLIVVQSYAAAIAAVLTAMGVAGVLTPAWLLTLTFAIGCAAALTAPAWQAIQPELVPREQIPAAASLGSITVNGARAVGPALAGVLVAAAGPAAVFGLNAVSFLGIIAALISWRRVPSAPLGERRTARPIDPGRSALHPPRPDRAPNLAASSGVRCSRVCAVGAAAGDRRAALASGRRRLRARAGAARCRRGGRCRDDCAAAGNVLRQHPAGRVGGPVRGWAAGGGVPAVRRGGAMAVVVGVAWIATLTTLNASAQLSLAPWVRARGLSMYLLTFMGSQAVGSVLWGALASHLGLAQSLTAAAALLAATAASVAVLPLLPDTGRLDRTTSTAWPTPTLVFEPEPADGPVLIWTSYRVAAQRFDEFRRAMMHVRGSRLRTGGYGWRLYRSGDEPDVVVEQFTVPSWGEFYRQHTTRWLGSDHAAVAAAMALTRNGRAEQHWFLAVAG